MSRLPRLADGTSIVQLYHQIRKLIWDGACWPWRDDLHDTVWGQDVFEVFELIDLLEAKGISEDNWQLFRQDFTVSDTVRTVWVLLGGEAVCQEPTYEQTHCALQSVFHDLRRMVSRIHQTRGVKSGSWRAQILRAFDFKHIPRLCRLSSRIGATRIRPTDPVRQWILDRREEETLRRWIKRTFGVWTGRRHDYRSEPWACDLTLLLIMAIPAAILWALFALSKPLALILTLPLVVAQMVTMVVFLVVVLRTDRFPEEVRTLGDLAAHILRKRSEAEAHPRIRPSLLV